MAKDPAFLFYYQDFLVGTSFMTKEEKGCYIEILCHLADKGKLDDKHMQSICSPYAFTDILKSKFSVDEVGLFYHKRLAFEVEKRKNYAQSRRKNAKAYAKHMENENTNTSIPTAFDTAILKKATVFNFEDIWSKYPSRTGKKSALSHFKATVRTEKDMDDIHAALDNYLKSDRVKKGFIQNGSTWFNNWKDWVDFVEPVAAIDEEKELMRKAGLINDRDSQTSNRRSYHEG